MTERNSQSHRPPTRLCDQPQLSVIFSVLTEASGSFGYIGIPLPFIKNQNHRELYLPTFFSSLGSPIILSFRMPSKNTTLAGFCSASRAYNVTVFSADPSGPKRGIRKKLSAKDRAKVHAVRRTGACLSCRMLKVPVSGGPSHPHSVDSLLAGEHV